MMKTDSELGKIKEILSPGADDAWSSNDQRKRFTFTIIRRCYKVDVENQRIDVDIPEGLIDDEVMY